MAEIRQLSNNCRAGKVTVTPDNWNTKNANPAETWLISFRFYDDNTGQSKQVRNKESKIKTLKAKQDFIKGMLLEIENDLTAGYNFITNSNPAETVPDFVRDQQGKKKMSITAALWYAHKKLNCSKSFETVSRSALNNFIAALTKHNLHNIPVTEFDEQYIKHGLEITGKEKIAARAVMTPQQLKRVHGQPWNNNRYNHFRAILNALYLILEDEKIVPRNFAKGVRELKKTDPERQIITKTERNAIRENRENVPYEFYRFINIMFASGRRFAELMRVKKEDIKLHAEIPTVKVLQKKGRSYKYVEFAITENMDRYWNELYEQAQPGQYIFSKGLRPGEIEIPPVQITRRFKRWFKDKGLIQADGYTLKHANLDDIAAKKGIAEASKVAGHSSIVVTMEHYATGEKARELARLRKISNDL